MWLIYRSDTEIAQCYYIAFIVPDITFVLFLNYKMNILREVAKGGKSKLSTTLGCKAQDLGTFAAGPLYEPSVETKKVIHLKK